MNESANRFREAYQAEDSDLGDFFSSAAAQGKDYLAAEKEYLLLSAYEIVGKAAGGLFSLLFSLLAGLMFLLFASVALALWLGSLLASNSLGFLITGGFYLLAFLIMHFVVRNAVRGSIMLNVVNSFFDDKD